MEQFENDLLSVWVADDDDCTVRGLQNWVVLLVSYLHNPVPEVVLNRVVGVPVAVVAMGAVNLSHSLDGERRWDCLDEKFVGEFLGGLVRDVNPNIHGHALVGHTDDALAHGVGGHSVGWVGLRWLVLACVGFGCC